MAVDESGVKQASSLPARSRFGERINPGVGAGTQFKKGQSGNPAGKPKGRHLSTVIRQS